MNLSEHRRRCSLIELKTTRQDRFERVDHVYQLLGYVLLDYSEQFQLDAIGVYLSPRRTRNLEHLDARIRVFDYR
jgi:hypothetical protein